MSADEIHQAEVEHLQPGQCGDFHDIAQRAMSLDQHVDRDFPLDPARGTAIPDISDQVAQLRGRGTFRDRNISDLIAGARQGDVDILPCMRVRGIVNKIGRASCRERV